MSAGAPTPAQLARVLSRARGEQKKATRFGVRISGTWTGPDRIRVGEEEFRVVACRSALEARAALADSDAAERLVLVTDRDERDLGRDVVARLGRRRLLPIDPWVVLLELFAATRTESRLTRERWLVESLLAAAPIEGYEPAATGFLDLETAWDAFARHVLSLPGGRPDLREVLTWARDPARSRAFREGSAALRDGVRARFVETAGAEAEAVLLLLGHSDADPLATGLVCAALRNPLVQRTREAREAAVRLETQLGGRQLPGETLTTLGAEAEALARKLSRDGYGAVRPVLEQADALLASLKAEAVAVASDFLPSGFEARLRKAAAALRDVLKGKAGADDLAPLVRDAARHLSGERFPERVEALRMAARLARWLSRPEAPAEGIVKVAADYAASGSWVDLARERLGVSEPVKELAGAYRDLRAAATLRRERENERFARAVVPWNGQAPAGAGLVAVERLLSDVAAPLAKEQALLLVVADGMSYAVFRQLLGDVVDRHGWMEIGPPGLGRRENAVAALPTLTEVSRASLLTGALVTGDSAAEKAGFAAHSALLAACRPGRPPVLFHKAELGDGRYGLSDPVADAIHDAERRVVGVVLNAVDDHLDKGEQVLAPWSLDYVPLMRNLLDAAESSGRVVLLTADHGHVPGEGTAMRSHADAGERSRPPEPPPAEGEVLASGPRVVAPGGRVVLAFGETVRYAPKKAGYHGGASPQEAVVPACVLTRREPPKGWDQLPPEAPDWWEEPSAAAAAAPAPKPGTQAPLFAPREERVRELVPALLASEAFRHKLDEVKRTGLTEEIARRVLTALEKRGGTMTRTALARELNVPEMRVSTQVTALRRVLNVEGYAVLSSDDAGASVVLNLDLLATQFEV